MRLLSFLSFFLCISFCAMELLPGQKPSKEDSPNYLNLRCNEIQRLVDKGSVSDLEDLLKSMSHEERKAIDAMFILKKNNAGYTVKWSLAGWATRKGHADVLRVFHRCGMRIDTDTLCDGVHYSPLAVAVEGRNVSCIKTLCALQEGLFSTYAVKHKGIHDKASFWILYQFQKEEPDKDGYEVSDDEDDEKFTVVRRACLEAVVDRYVKEECDQVGPEEYERKDFKLKEYEYSDIASSKSVDLEEHWLPIGKRTE